MIPSLIGLFTAIIASYLSAKWAVRRALAERWWERKIKAYSEIIDALHDLIRYSELCAKQEISGDELPKKKEFAERYCEAYWHMQKAFEIGPFVISDHAAQVLQKLNDRPKLDWDENSPLDIREEECKHYRKALEELRNCAKRDLKA